MNPNYAKPDYDIDHDVEIDKLYKTGYPLDASPIKSPSHLVLFFTRISPKSPEGEIPQSPVRSAGMKDAIHERPERLPPSLFTSIRGVQPFRPVYVGVSSAPGAAHQALGRRRLRGLA